MKPAVKGGARDGRFALVAAARPALTTDIQFAGEIGRLWGEAHARFVEIGDRLEEAKERLPHGAFIHLVENQLPFGRSVAHKLMAAATAIRTGALPPEFARAPYSTAYQLSTLSAEERREAEQAGIVRLDVTRAEIVDFKRGRKAVLPAPAPDRRREIEKEIARLEARLAELRRQRAALDDDALG